VLGGQSYSSNRLLRRAAGSRLLSLQRERNSGYLFRGLPDVVALRALGLPERREAWRRELSGFA
jgi:hypothetical protein